MDARDREQVIKEMQQAMQQRSQLREEILDALKHFTNSLFIALEKAVAVAQQSGIQAFNTPRRLAHPGGNGLSILQLFIEDWSIVLVPLMGVARPALKDEAQVPGARLKEPTGRIAAFLSEDPSTAAFYDFLVFHDGSWFAWGYGWPRQQATLEDTDFEALAFELLFSFGRDIYTVWPTRAETVLKQATDKNRPSYELRVLRSDE